MRVKKRTPMRWESKVHNWHLHWESEWVSTERHRFLITWPVPVPPLTWPTTVFWLLLLLFLLSLLFPFYQYLSASTESTFAVVLLLLALSAQRTRRHTHFATVSVNARVVFSLRQLVRNQKESVFLWTRVLSLLLGVLTFSFILKLSLAAEVVAYFTFFANQWCFRFGSQLEISGLLMNQLCAHFIYI